MRASGDSWPCGGHHALGGEGGAAGGAAMQDRSMPPHPTKTDVMLIDQNLSDQDMTSNAPKKRRIKTKKSGSRNHGGHSTQHRKHFQKEGSGSLQKETMNPEQELLQSEPWWT